MMSSPVRTEADKVSRSLCGLSGIAGKTKFGRDDFEFCRRFPVDMTFCWNPRDTSVSRSKETGGSFSCFSPCLISSQLL